MKKSSLITIWNMSALIGIAVLMASGSALAIGKVGEMAYEWTNLTDLDGKKHNLVEARGKVVLLTTVQSTCGGCLGNAPHIGTIAMKFQGQSFQAFGADVDVGTVKALRTFEGVLKGSHTNLDFPILKGADSQLVSATDGWKWTKYDSYRDVYFVLDHNGKILFRSDGDRRHAMDSARFVSLDSAITKAIANIPTTSIRTSTNAQGMCLRACRSSGVYQINLVPQLSMVDGNVVLRILDGQGRTVRMLEWNPLRSGSSVERQAVWDGKDFQGRSVAWGSYYLSATAQNTSVSLLLPWLP